MGVARPYRKAVIAAACAATAVSALLLVHPRMVEPLEIDGARLFKNTGREEGSARVATEGRDAPGFLIFGPYVSLRAGCYETQLFYDADYPRDGRPAIWDGYSAGRVVARGELSAAGPGATLHQLLQVAPGDRIPNFELRVRFRGSGRIRIKKLVIRPAACPVAGTDNA